MSDSPQLATKTEVVPPGSTRDLYEEALADRLVSDRDAAKALIAGRIKEIDRLKALLARAEAGLAELLEKDVSEVAALADRQQPPRLGYTEVGSWLVQ